MRHKRARMARTWIYPAVVLAVGGLSLGLVGCGGGDDNGGTPAGRPLTVNAEFEAANRALPGFVETVRVTLNVPAGVTYNGPRELTITRTGTGAGLGNAVTFTIPSADGYTLSFEARSGNSVVGTTTANVTRTANGDFNPVTISTIQSSITGAGVVITPNPVTVGQTATLQGVAKNAQNQNVILGSTAVFEFSVNPSTLGTISGNTFTAAQAGLGTIDVTLRGLDTPLTGSEAFSVVPGTPTTGNAEVNVRWEAREAARGVPAYAEAIVVRLKQNGVVVPNGTIIVNRRSDSAAYTETINWNGANFPAGNYTVDVQAYSQPANLQNQIINGDLVAQALDIPITIPTSTPVSIDTEVNSLIARYQLEYDVNLNNNFQLVPDAGPLANLIQANVGQTLRLRARALNAQGAIILGDPNNDRIKFVPGNGADATAGGQGTIWLDNLNSQLTVNRAGTAQFSVRATGTGASGQAPDRVITVSAIGRGIVAFVIPATVQGNDLEYPAAIGLRAIAPNGTLGNAEVIASGTNHQSAINLGVTTPAFQFTDPSYQLPNFTDPAVLAVLRPDAAPADPNTNPIFTHYHAGLGAGAGALSLDEPSLNADGTKLAFVVKPIVRDAQFDDAAAILLTGAPQEGVRQARNRGDIVVVDLIYNNVGNVTGIGSRQPQTPKRDLNDDRYPTWDRNGRLFFSTMPVNPLRNLGWNVSAVAGSVGELTVPNSVNAAPLTQAILNVTFNAGDGLSNGQRKIHVRNSITALPDNGANVTGPQPGNHFWPAVKPDATQMTYIESAVAVINPTVGVAGANFTEGLFEAGLDTGNPNLGSLAVFTFQGPVRITSSFVTDVFLTERVAWGVNGGRILVNRQSAPNDINQVLNDNALGTVAVEKNGGSGGWLYELVDSNNPTAGVQEALVYRQVPSNEIRIKFTATGPANDGFTVATLGRNPVFSIPVR